MIEKLQLRDAVYRLEDTIREIRNRFADDQGRVDEIAFEESKADPLLALAGPLDEPIAGKEPLPGVVQLATEIINRCVAELVGSECTSPNALNVASLELRFPHLRHATRPADRRAHWCPQRPGDLNNQGPDPPRRRLR